jgi:hypothetical protein
MLFAIAFFVFCLALYLVGVAPMAHSAKVTVFAIVFTVGMLLLLRHASRVLL